MSIFKKAERKKAKLRMALIGPSGSGKTKSALRLANGIGGKIAVLDTERDSASLYNDVCDFDTVALNPPFSPERYIHVIKEAEKEGYNILIIDSLSHAWAGEGGLLEIVDKYTAASRTKNAFTEGWRHGTPEQNKLINAILNSNMHVICCLRTKTAHELQPDEKGKLKPVKIGLAPIQREGVDYEFTLIFDIESESHYATASKNRTSLFKGAPFLITEDTGKQISEWLNEGISVDESKVQNTKDDYLSKINECTNDEQLLELCKKAKEEFSDDINYHALLRTKYKERKEQLEFINELQGDQRSNGSEQVE